MWWIMEESWWFWGFLIGESAVGFVLAIVLFTRNQQEKPKEEDSPPIYSVEQCKEKAKNILLFEHADHIKETISSRPLTVGQDNQIPTYFYWMTIKGLYGYQNGEEGYPDDKYVIIINRKDLGDVAVLKTVDMKKVEKAINDMAEHPPVLQTQKTTILNTDGTETTRETISQTPTQIIEEKERKEEEKEEAL